MVFRFQLLISSLKLRVAGFHDLNAGPYDNGGPGRPTKGTADC
uniref:Uncharacterized protein n=1 Tax=Arundo donax TaxID=35708 RepID=A0A0A9GDF6_ARUDO